MKPSLASRTLFAFVATCAFAASALAQDERATDTPRPQDIDPAVDTSAPTRDARDEQGPADIDPAVDTSPEPSAQAQGSARPAARGRALDRIELDTTEISGNRELPKVLYIVPWKRADLGDLVGKPVNSLLDEVLAPVDRDVFRRENRYYRALTPGADEGAGAASVPESRARPVDRPRPAGSVGSAIQRPRPAAGTASPGGGEPSGNEAGGQ